ncbi:MAG: LTA synthase family protein [Pseudomonadota bacterium]
MIEPFFVLLIGVVGALLADSLARPHAQRDHYRMRTFHGVWILVMCEIGLFGTFLAPSGNITLALVLSLALMLLISLASNAKNRVLGEPLLFSDLALLGPIVKHPQFYFSVLAFWQQVVGALALVVLIGVLVWLFEPDKESALAGVALSLGSLTLLALSLRMNAFARLAPRPDIENDVARLGLVPTLILYWLRWRKARLGLAASVGEAVELDRVSAPPPNRRNELLVVVQCESFAEPKDLFDRGGVDLPELARAREQSVQWGHLYVSGFGAYTMRTEYGVLFGKAEEALGFLLYDPYLTAQDDPTPALPKKLGLAGWQSTFVHPHDMRFYSRHEIMPKAGFAALVGEDQFPKPPPETGRYVSDSDVGEKILDIASGAQTRMLIYAVTMENHGPWAPHGDAHVTSMVDNYNRLVRASDAMLGQLLDGLNALGKPATLVFFGDHRPTIPGASDPGGDKHTPYAIVQFGKDRPLSEPCNQPVDLTPAQLHHVIMDLVEKP